MIVNVNPYDTGMEENSHVMKFASVARQVVTLKSEPPVQAGSRLPEAPPAPEASPKESTVGDVTVEEQDVDDEDAEEEEEDPLVTYLFDLVEEQRRQVSSFHRSTFAPHSL